MENWQTVLFDTMRSGTNKYVISVFYIVWIFLGNFILLNLFLAILLDSFLEEDEDGDGQDGDIAKKIRKRMLAEARKKRLNANKVFMSTNLIKMKPIGQKKEDSEEELEELDIDEILKIYKDQGIY